MAKAAESPLVILYKLNVTKVYCKEANLFTFLIAICLIAGTYRELNRKGADSV